MALFETSFIETLQCTVSPDIPARAGKRSLHGWIVIAYIRSYTADINHRQRSGAALLAWQRAAAQGAQGDTKSRRGGGGQKNTDEMKVYLGETAREGSESEILMQSTALLQPVWDSRGSLEWHWRGPSANLPVDPHKSCTCSWLYPGVPPLYKHITCSSAHAGYMRHYGAYFIRGLRVLIMCLVIR